MKKPFTVFRHRAYYSVDYDGVLTGEVLGWLTKPEAHSLVKKLNALHERAEKRCMKSLKDSMAQSVKDERALEKLRKGK